MHTNRLNWLARLGCGVYVSSSAGPCRNERKPEGEIKRAWQVEDARRIGHSNGRLKQRVIGQSCDNKR
jgi:hypothetical protein